MTFCRHLRMSASIFGIRGVRDGCIIQVSGLADLELPTKRIAPASGGTAQSRRSRAARDDSKG